MWLAHHYPADYERCVRLGRHHVCRRCLVLYPIAVASLIAAAAGLRWDRSLELVLLFAFPLPSTVEFVLEHIGATSYRPARQLALMVPLAVAFGVGLDRYLGHPADPLFWAVVVTYCTVWGAAALVGSRRARS
jgi:hypothetical protein